jgi:ribosomal protein L7Ae-like RNA K-turn-binding protein
VYKLLGLARRAGAVAHGTAAVRESIRVGEAKLVLLAADASPTQLDKIRRTMERRPVPQVSVGDRVTLGGAVGVAPVSAVAVTSVPLAERVLAELGGVVPALDADVVETDVEAAEE